MPASFMPVDMSSAMGTGLETSGLKGASPSPASHPSMASFSSALSCNTELVSAKLIGVVVHSMTQLHTLTRSCTAAVYLFTSHLCVLKMLLHWGLRLKVVSGGVEAFNCIC
jgi:hypothetical protein